MVGVGVGDGAGVGVATIVGVAVGLAIIEGVALGLATTVGVEEGSEEGVEEGVGEGEGETATEGDGLLRLIAPTLEGLGEGGGVSGFLIELLISGLGVGTSAFKSGLIKGMFRYPESPA